ncbi:MAG: nucleotidyl transferase AbiEii/AbiGii toxin family protein, partial [Clostridiales bacterium]|nr:nucleotidyl transferase AbiEii/AbiGii toxin family protein [Clostridiales bacterium]
MMDRAKSVIAKLKNKSAITGKPLQLHLQLFCQEELLRRISLSRYVDNLVLKGGLFIYTLTNFESRATIDIDFLLRDFPSDIEDIKRIIGEIINVETEQDYVVFEILSFSEITPLRKYKGTSIQLVGRIGNTRTPINVDFGIGDVIVPSSEMRN